jgi:hypothetical protein
MILDKEGWKALDGGGDIEVCIQAPYLREAGGAIPPAYSPGAYNRSEIRVISGQC